MDETRTPILTGAAGREGVDELGKRTGMWFFLFTELLFFGGMFLLYSIYRYKFAADFHRAAADENLVLGSVNTAILLTSSLAMVLAVAAVRRGQIRRSLGFQRATISLGTVFLVIKGIEWGAKIARGIYPNGPTLLSLGQGEILFFGLYFTMTGLHALHVPHRHHGHRLHDPLHQAGASSDPTVMPGWRTPDSTGISWTSSGSISFRLFYLIT